MYSPFWRKLLALLNNMEPNENDFFGKLRSSLPWLVRYPFERAKNLFSRTSNGKKHYIFTIANHFEPSWSENGLLSLDDQQRKIDAYIELARQTADALKDSDGVKFSHTNFYPAEQYDPALVTKLSDMQREGLGEVEIHLHHGVDSPDTAENTKRALLEFRNALAEDHKCLSRLDGTGDPRYAFVHGNLALANSAHGRFCGVDQEMKILQETGCYVDMTLPTAPDVSQVPMINSIYECAKPLEEKMPHRQGKRLSIGRKVDNLPVIFTGPLVFNWRRRLRGIPFPRLDDGALTANQPMDLTRFKGWSSANVTVKGRPDWVFIKLYCHGFFPQDQSNCIGEGARRLFDKIIENGDKTGQYSVHFASAREAVNMVYAAIENKLGNPNDFRNYRLKSIMSELKKSVLAYLFLYEAPMMSMFGA